VTTTASEVEAIFRACGAYLDGHFLLASGRHSPRYLEKFRVLQWPERTERLCAAIAGRARPLAATTVAGPTTGGVILAHEVARQMGLRAVYAERADDGVFLVPPDGPGLGLELDPAVAAASLVAV
jgi:orotate phosphoribosyltransferase